MHLRGSSLIPPRLICFRIVHNKTITMSRRVNSHIALRPSPRQVTPDKRGIRKQEKYSLVNQSHSFRAPSPEEMRAVFLMCRGNHWDSVFNSIRSNRLIATTKMRMDNNITTTVLHQALTSKGDIRKRARVVQEVLGITPHAATIKNGYGTLPLHVISQRNTKMDSKTKEMLIRNLVEVYPESIIQQGGVGRRTPMHIIFTDYVSPALTSTMIHYGRQACFMRDKKGFLPIHVACSRHCSPEKLEMLLRVNPNSLFTETNDGRSLLDLAKSKATKSHPNYALISDIERRLKTASLTVSPSRSMAQLNVPVSQDHTSDFFIQETVGSSSINAPATSSSSSIPRQRKSKRKRKVASARDQETCRADNQELVSTVQMNPPIKQESSSMEETNVPIKQEDNSEQANLLLHFSRHMENVASV